LTEDKGLGSGAAEPRDADKKQSASHTEIASTAQLRPHAVRRRLPNRRPAETFDIEVAGLRYTATVGRFSDGRIGELFLNNHKSNSQADTNARDSAIVFSFAVQHGADPEAIRKALCRNEDGAASGPLGAALDIIAQDREGESR
jgi:hypothetical protein